MSFIFIFFASSVLLIVIPILLKLLNVLPLILIGCFLPIMGYLMISKYYTFEAFQSRKIQEERIHYFEFYRRDNWGKNVDHLDTVELLKNESLYPDNFLINDSLNNFIKLLIHNFVSIWSKKISTSNSFDTSLQHVLSFSIKSMIQRLSDINFADILVLHLIPIFNDHIKNFIAANEISKRRNASDLNKIEFDEDLLALHYNKGRLHPGLQLNSQTSQSDLKDHLNSIVDKILPYLLESSETESRSSFILVRELLACCVLNPICQLLSDPDFLNQVIVDNLSKQIKDRNSVKQIRNILRQHSMNISEQSSSIDILNQTFTPSSSSKEFLEVANNIQRSNDIDNIQKFKYYCLIKKYILLKDKTKTQIEESKDLHKYIKRLDTLCHFIDLKAKGEDADWNSLQSVDLASYPWVEYPEIDVPDIPLESILVTPSRLKYYSFFMQQRGERKILLDFWIETDVLRNPLEFNTEIENPIVLTGKEDEESSDEDTGVFSDRNFSQSAEIIVLFKKFFNLPIMKVPPKIYYKVSEYVESSHDEPIAYNRARRNMLKLQFYEYSRMLKTDYIAFKKSNIWIKMMIEELSKTFDHTNHVEYKPEEHQIIGKDETYLPGESYGDPLAVYREKEDVGNYVDVNMTGRVSDKVVQAVEDALSQIMDDQNKVEIAGITEQHEKRNSRLVSDDVVNDLFGADDGLFSDVDDSFEESARTSVDAAELNDSSNELSDHDSLIDEDISNSVELLPVAPNMLDLSKEISLIEEEICRLQEQKLIINTLLNKAEVINNIPECRILRKSLLSLEKEIKMKNLQQEQLKVQEGENSLYQKSDVKINNYITVKDKPGKTYVMYAIKVLRYSSSDRTNVVASWIVTRRFSQFYELHNHLKEFYPEVRSIDFPKRTVMVKFLPSALILERQQTLGKYLKKLITLKGVCEDKHFRAFLSSETFESTNKNDHSTVFRSTNGVDALSTQVLLPLISLVDKESSESTISNSKSTQNKLEGIETKMNEQSFTKPICKLVILLFQLSKSTNWLRGKGLILLFQQIFGSTIEKTIRKVVDGKLRSEENVSLLLMNLQFKLFPDGKFMQKSPPRSELDKMNTRHQAKTLLALFLNDTTAKIFGRTAAKEAADLTYAMFQNEILNKHLVLSFIDELFMCLFPEIRQ